MYYWFMLFLAIITEVASTSFMKMASGSNPVLGYTLMAVLISISYFFLSQAVRKIPLAIAYTMWEGLGLLLISLMSWHFFDETFSNNKLMAMALLMTGMVLMNLGEKLSEKRESEIKERTFTERELQSCRTTCN
ncbi:DMT family transporter [Endozoicomonas sp.]|uniref:DMT family transporter n=1 Tax=Endozoicomonas sp. TaxID=1892382 RepID=UPI002888547E|nr:multidrug efflux SMR transporter [Endozoicomonas sp.]